MPAIPLLTSAQAIQARQQARAMVLAGESAEACTLLTVASLSLRHADLLPESVQTEVLLGWAQNSDGRPWQAARTLLAAQENPDFNHLPRWTQARAHINCARALWDMQDFAGSAQQARIAVDLADSTEDRAWALLNLGHAVLHLDRADAAEDHFRAAMNLDPSLELIAMSIQAYFLNLKGQHRRALHYAEAGIALLCQEEAQVTDAVYRAVERSALMVERGTAKAFLGHADARAALLDAQQSLAQVPLDVELEQARTKRAQALVLVKARERQAALVLVNEALRVFRQRHASSEYDLTLKLLNRL